MLKQKYDEKQVALLAQGLAAQLQAGTVILLIGDLGAGKTTFTRYLARGLQIEDRITSPTFTLIKEYDEGRLPLYHIDAYRANVDADGDMLEEYIYGQGITVIEWPSCIDAILPQKFIQVELQFVDEVHREVTVTTTDERYRECVEEGLQ